MESKTRKGTLVDIRPPTDYLHHFFLMIFWNNTKQIIYIGAAMLGSWIITFLAPKLIQSKSCYVCGCVCQSVPLPCQHFQSASFLEWSTFEVVGTQQKPFWWDECQWQFAFIIHATAFTVDF